MILEVEHLSFAYRPERPLFYDVSFAFEQGQVLSILGANGAGNCGRFPESSAMFPRATPPLMIIQYGIL